jgi:hypothetical protein
MAGSLAVIVRGGSDFVERKTQFDQAAFDAVVGQPAQIRQLIEAVAFNPRVLNNVKNSLNGLHAGHGHSQGRIAIAFAGYGPSSAYGYTDDVWQEYRLGEFLKVD